MNGKKCLIKRILRGTTGTQLCGGWFKEEVFRVRGCYITVPTRLPLTVRVWTTLDGEADDESFGVDNIKILKLEEKGCSAEIYYPE